MKGLQEGIETSSVVWFGDGSTEQKTGNRAGGGRGKDVEILFGSDEAGQDKGSDGQHRADILETKLGKSH